MLRLLQEKIASGPFEASRNSAAPWSLAESPVAAFATATRRAAARAGDDRRLGRHGGWEGMAAETIYDHAKSPDKSLAFIEGATHLYTPCTRCETTPGQYGDTIKTAYDYIDGWLSKPGRFR